MKIYYQKIFEYLDREIKLALVDPIYPENDDNFSFTMRKYRASVLEKVKENINGIIKEEREKLQEDKK